MIPVADIAVVKPVEFKISRVEKLHAGN